MIRIIVMGIYILPATEAEIDFKTFDIENPEIENYLKENISYMGMGSRQIIGAEIIDKN